jgi:hypothetical protein
VLPDKEETDVGIGVSLLLVAAGAILIGVILMIVGLAGLVLSLVFWSSWGGPGYFSRRRETVVEDAPPPPTR